MRETTQVEGPVTQVEIQEQPQDTPRSINNLKPEFNVPTRAYVTTLLAVATATQILGSPPITQDIAYAGDMTCLNDEQPVAGAQEFFLSSYPSTAELSQESEAKETNRTRLELLARQYVTKRLSVEEDARLAILTEKIRKLIPRVTAGDFQQLHDIAAESEEIRARSEERRQRLGL